MYGGWYAGLLLGGRCPHGKFFALLEKCVGDSLKLLDKV